MKEIRHNWTKEEILAIYNQPMMDLLFEAAKTHRESHDPNVVQVSTLLSIKTGGCSEDCAYCPQAARYHTGLKGNDLMSVEDVKQRAVQAKTVGASRVCMGAENVRKTNVTVCSGGIIGMGEKVEDRAGMLVALSTLNPHPESVPINTLVAVAGTPLEDEKPVEIWDLVRMVATARIVMPKTQVRLSAGRTNISQEGQALCFFAGANSIFAGDKLLTTPNPDVNEDMKLFKLLNLTPQKPFAKKEQPTSVEAQDSQLEPHSNLIP